MKALVLINENNNTEIQWKFDQVMALIAFEVELTIVFMPNTENQITQNKAWKSLSLYGVNDVYAVNYCKTEIKPLFPLHNISPKQLKRKIQQMDVIL